jgi:hypothetical protein
MLVMTMDNGKVWKLADDLSAWTEFVTGSASVAWSAITDKPSTFAPSAHTHSVADVSGLQTQLDGKQAAGSYAAASHTHTSSQVTDFAAAVIAAAPPTTNASLLTSGTVDAARLPASIVLTTDSRLSDARTPLSHVHSVSDVTGLQTALDSKQVAGSYAASSHTHTASQVSGLASVATSGSYADLSNKPTAYTLPSATTTTSGGVVIGSGLSVSSGTVSANVTSVAGRTGAVTIASTDVSGLPTAGTGSTNYCAGNDSRLSDARQPTSHTHGNITNAGAIGSTTGQVVVTTTSGVLTTAATISASSQVSGLATVATSGLASDLSGTLADARLSSNVATYATLAAAASQPASTLDIYPRGEASSLTIGPASGSVFFTWFTPATTFTVSAITMASGSTAASGLTLCRFGIYTFDETTATLVARTASDTTIFGAVNSSYQRSLSTVGGFPATYTLTAGTRYGVGVAIVGTTAPTLAGKVVAVGVSTLSPKTNGTITGQSDLPTSVTSIGTAQGHAFARLT